MQHEAALLTVTQLSVSHCECPMAMCTDIQADKLITSIHMSRVDRDNDRHSLWYDTGDNRTELQLICDCISY